MRVLVEQEADRLRRQHGALAHREALRLLEAATAAMNHKAGILYAEVCTRLAP